LRTIHLKSVLSKLRIVVASLFTIVLPLQSAQHLTTGIDVRGQSGWARYGTVESVSAHAIKLTPITTGIQQPGLPSGQITGTTRVWTAEALRGFEGSVVVFLLDENKQLLYQTHERHWGVNGEAIPGGAPSSRTETWTEPIAANVMAQTRYLAILHSDHPILHWEDAMEQLLVGAGYVLMAGVCIVFTGGFEFVDHEVECGAGGGDDSEGSAATANQPTLARLTVKGTPPQMPHSGQVVWLNRVAKQVVWTEFPIHAHRKDDVGTSHYLETEVMVFYPPTTANTPHQPAVIARGTPPVTSCCIVTGIDQRSGTVTGQVNGATDRVFRFRVTNPAVLRAIKVGQGIYANFKTKQVSLDGAAPCACTWLEDPAKPR
jgi:hypothetical protein